MTVVAVRQDQPRGFIYLAGRAFTLEELGPAADMPLSEGMQSLVDRGFFGEVPTGTTWNELEPKFTIHQPADVDETLIQSAWKDWKDAEQHALDAHTCMETRRVLNEKYQRYLMVEKLTAS